MKRLLYYGSFLAFVFIALLCMHGAASAATCTMTQPAQGNLFTNYDPPVSTPSTAITVSAGTLNFTCSGLGTGNAAHVYVMLNGSTSGTFVTPFLTGPNGFQLTYTPCIPNSGTCNGATNLWQNTMATAFKITNGVNGTNSVPSFSIFVGRQDAFVGTVSQYTGGLTFSFICGEGQTQAPC